MTYKNAMVLSMHTYTPISFWLSRPLSEMQTWIVTHNEILKEREVRANGK